MSAADPSTTLDRPLDVLVVPHTHWDREWYHPVGRLRQRLVALVDELLDDPVPPPGSFLLDGQGAVLDDYLAVRPERRDALAAAVRDGWLEAGPWYVLADELIPSGEALVRNLLAGRRTLAALGGSPPPVLYSPDAFGHAAALPVLARGFGCGVTIAWRGYGGARWPDGDAAWWRAPDGEATLLFHLPPDGYEYGSSLPADPRRAADRWREMRAVLAPRARLGLVLVQNGADHHARQRRWREALDALREAAAPDRVSHASLPAFADEAGRRARETELPTVQGELRDSYGYAWTLQGTFATRAAQKRRNAHAQRLLERDVEPWLALLALRDGVVGDGADDGRRALLQAAWRTLLLCHPHDTLCGCSTDEVARAADARFDDAIAQGRGLRSDALALLLGHDADAAREQRSAWRPTLVVRNRAARARGGATEVELATFVRDVAVGPGSAGTWRPVKPLGATPHVRAGDDDLPLQILGRALRHDRVEAPRHYPDDDIVEAARAVVWVPRLDGHEVRAFAIAATAAESGAAGPSHPVRVGDGTLDNGLLGVAVDARGRVSLRALGGAVHVESLVGFEDVGDAGDTYTHSPVGAPLRSAWFAGAKTVDRGPLRGTLELRYRLRVPAALRVEPDADTFSRPTKRAGRHVEIPLTVRLSLDADASFVRVHVRGDNVARDHRLRVVFASGVRSESVLADAALGPVVRTPIAVPAGDAVAERPPDTAPLHRWVARTDGQRTSALVSDGLGEYEARPDGAIAVTLVRAVGELSRPDLPERPGHAGWPVATPEAQCPGPFEARFAVALLDGPLDPAAVERLADDVLLPLCGETLRPALVLPPPAGGLTLDGDGLAFSCAKPSDDGEWVVLRCVNATDREVRGVWRLRVPVRDAVAARLDETPGASLAVEGAGDESRLPIVVPPRGVSTVLVR
ncbi:glycoside hydrolase family 38 [Gemmatirosa kalamazoonensis]|uniref:Glycoside hydrolase family 38 n=1 Tax=Gemmatirosa kalamazoonensis TaxID=861299 RepID=W0RNZ2_9BACT|nr:glycoside hydrolase family 38 C-terminal domain-containing protein [Gemmatirosa kalamazoonensis]AHG91178.1 glycoside hydrolase family 38 [Gemmatirosa kalamazoonensis]